MTQSDGWNTRKNESDRVILDMSKKYKKHTRKEWDFVAQRCGNPSTMKKENGALYQYGRRRGWHKSTDWQNRKSRFGYTEEQLKKEVFDASRKFHSRGEFRNKDIRNYTIARIRGWLDEMHWLENQKNIFRDKLSYIYIYRFEPQKTFYVGETFHGSDRHYQHKKRGPVFDFAKQNGVEIPKPIILEDNLDRLNEVREKEDFWKNYYISLGYNTLNKGKTGKFSGSLGGCRKMWTKNKCYEVALLCSSSKEMRERFPGAYGSAWKNDWLKDYTWFVKTSRPILQYAKDGRLIKRWDSVRSAARGIHGFPCAIRWCCKGKTKSAYGHVWKYADEAIPV